MIKVRDNMIDFIIVEDNFAYFSVYKTVVDNIMMNYDIEYNITVYDKFSSNIKRLLKKDNFKVYIISYSKTKNSLEMINYIREELDDWQSLIIIMNEENRNLKE